MKIDPDTMVFGIIGYPLSHSLSPIMHNMAFREKGINAIYLYFPCRFVEGVVSGMKALSIKGLSVTIPHKESICKYLDEIDPIAKKIGAVNTLVNRDGKIIGYNTDAYGAAKAIKKRIDGLEGKDVLIIGAGGAARAIAFALKEEGAKLFIANRSRERGERLSKDVGAEFFLLSQIPDRRFDIIIQATSVGMYPNVDEILVSDKILKEGTIVMDIVYNPMETKFLKIAKEKGCQIISGIDMFVYQGARQFELWTGKDAPIDLMKDIVVSYLREKAYDKRD